MPSLQGGSLKTTLIILIVQIKDENYIECGKGFKGKRLTDCKNNGTCINFHL